MYLCRTCGVALAAIALSACASAGPAPGSLEFIRLQQQQELAQACQRALHDEPPWKETYYPIGRGLFVTAHDYCRIEAQRAVQGMAFTR